MLFHIYSSCGGIDGGVRRLRRDKVKRGLGWVCVGLASNSMCMQENEEVGGIKVRVRH